ncbi:hypothetical protein KJ652_07250 [Patescibacteria group bacterium]|nr:hypothetical protein [Patescibacteria group bacterium]
MKCQNNLVVSALVGVVIGALMGAGTMQYAQFLSYSGSDPNLAKESMFVPHQIERFDGLAPTTRSLRTGEGTQPESLDFVNPQGQWKGAAEAEPSVIDAEGCDRFGEGKEYSARRAKCIVEERENGIEYQEWQMLPPQ